MRLGMVSTYLPRRCGLAEYAAELGFALAPEFDVVVCAVDRHGLNYPDEVAAVIREEDPGDYRRAARIMAEHGVDAVLIQHDATVYGGPSGSHLLELTSELRQRGIPYLLVLHTMRPANDQHWTRTVAALAAGAARVSVFTREAKRAVLARGVATAERIRVLPAAVRAVRPGDAVRPTIAAAVAGAETVIATVGFVSPAKCLETGIAAFAQLAADRPGLRYVIAGATHPDVARGDGETYRARLQAMVDELALADRVRFVDTHLSPAERAWLLARTQICVAPNFDIDRTQSGSLTAALVAGCAVVAGWHPFAAELLAGGGGLVVPGGDADALSGALATLLDDRPRLAVARRAAGRLGRRMTWPTVANRYAAVVRDVIGDQVPVVPTALPPLRLGRLARGITAETAAVVETAAVAEPIAVAGTAVAGPTADGGPVAAGTGGDEIAGRLAMVAAGLLGLPALALPPTGWTRAAEWGEAAITALVARLPATGPLADTATPWARRGLTELAVAEGVPAPLRERARSAARSLPPSGQAGGSLAALAVQVLALVRDPNAEDEVVAELAGRLEAARSTRPGWPWFADRFGGEDARLAQALIAAGHRLGGPDLVACGLASLDWYRRRAGLGTNDGVLRLPHPGPERSVDAAALVAALAEAYRATDSPGYARLAVRAFDWFHGVNRLVQPVYDPVTGSCAATLSDQPAWAAPASVPATLAYIGAAIDLDKAGIAALPAADAAVADPAGGLTTAV